MTSKFKPGDLIRCREGSISGTPRKGVAYTVRSVDTEGCPILTIDSPTDERGWSMLHFDPEPLTGEFSLDGTILTKKTRKPRNPIGKILRNKDARVGDKLEVLFHWPEPSLKTGDICTVRELDSTGYPILDIDAEDDEAGWIPDKRFRLIERDGVGLPVKKTRKPRSSAVECIPFPEGYRWKVGDRVRARRTIGNIEWGINEGKIYTVASTMEGESCLFEGQVGDFLWWPEPEDFELVVEKTQPAKRKAGDPDAAARKAWYLDQAIF